jgi:hypothetical protein
MKHFWTQIEQILKEKHGCKFPGLQKKDYLFLTGIRSSNKFTDAFDDSVHVLFVAANGNWFESEHPCTTKPGGFWLKHPMKPSGCAIVASGYYPNLWQVGSHKGQYEALVQFGHVDVYRDADLDLEYDLDSSTVESCYGCGINFHRSNPSTGSDVVDKWSAGCVVMKNAKDFDSVMAKARLHAAANGPVSFLLLGQKDFDELALKNSIS